MSVKDNLDLAFQRIGKDIRAIVNRVGFLERNLHYLTPVSTERSDPDTDGVYRRITHKRRDGTIIQISVIEHDPLIEIINGYYNKRVVSIYNKLGTAIIETATYQLKYDANGVLVSETLL